MTFTRKQRGVARGMAIAATCTVVAIAGSAAWQPAALLPGDNTVARIAFAFEWALLPALCLLVAIGRLARHHFFTPEDIDGGGLSSGTPKAHVLQAIPKVQIQQVIT